VYRKDGKIVDFVGRHDLRDVHAGGR